MITDGLLWIKIFSSDSSYVSSSQQPLIAQEHSILYLPSTDPAAAFTGVCSMVQAPGMPARFAYFQLTSIYCEFRFMVLIAGCRPLALSVIIGIAADVVTWVPRHHFFLFSKGLPGCFISHAQGSFSRSADTLPDAFLYISDTTFYSWRSDVQTCFLPYKSGKECS